MLNPPKLLIKFVETTRITWQDLHWLVFIGEKVYLPINKKKKNHPSENQMPGAQAYILCEKSGYTSSSHHTKDQL